MSLIDVDPADPDNETRDWFWRRTATLEARRRAEVAAAREAGVEEGRRRAGSPDPGRS